MLGEFVALGNVCIDDLVYANGTTQWGVPGGGAVYAALGIALWAGAAAVVAPLGPDFPRALIGERLDLSRCRAIAHTMRNWGLYEDDGARHFVSRRDSLPWADFSPQADDLGDATFACAHIAPMPWQRVAAVASALRARGARVISLDLHDRELAAMERGALAALLAQVDVFLPSRQDTEVLFPGRTPLAALHALRELAPGLAAIGVKCGAEGAIVHAAGALSYVDVPSAADVLVDATGAGDAFCGGFLAGFAGAGDVAEAALCGAVAASFAVAGVGPAALAAAPGPLAAARREVLRARIEHRPFHP